MTKRIVIIQGHPDPAGGHFGQALAAAYVAGAQAVGHEVRVIEVAHLMFPLVQSKQEFDTGSPPDSIRAAQETLAWAEHLVLVYPLWLGSMPALLKGFLEQVFRPGFAFGPVEQGRHWQKRLSGKSARIVVTMGMPALIYRWYFLAHSLKSLERNILGFCGIGPIKETLIGSVEGSQQARAQWLEKLHRLGQAGR